MPPAACLPRYLLAAEVVRGQVRDGTLAPGMAAPSGAELSRLTGYSHLTCLRGLRSLVPEGVLSPGLSRSARLRVAAPAQSMSLAEQRRATAEAALSAGLAVRRRAGMLTQLELARLAGVSITAVRHAETKRLWSAREFWESVDDALGACGELLRLYDAYLRARDAAPGGSRGVLPGAALTAREGEVAVLFAGGAKTRVIAARLGIAASTVRFHMVNVHVKAGTGGRSRGSRVRLAAWLQRRAGEEAVAAGEEEARAAVSAPA